MDDKEKKALEQKEKAKAYSAMMEAKLKKSEKETWLRPNHDHVFK